LPGCFAVPIPPIQRFGLEGFFMRWTAANASLLIISSEYDCMI